MAAGRRRRWPWVIVFTAMVLVAGFYLAGGWYFSNVAYDSALKAQPYDPASLQGGYVEAVELEGDEPGRVLVRPDDEHASDTKYDDAVVGLVIGESLLVVGPATAAGEGRQYRAVLDVVGDVPSAGDRYGLTRDVWLTPEQAGMEYEDVTITTPEGESFPAWLIPGEDQANWAVLTHGLGAARSEMLRMARPLHESGYNVLVITYRGDVGAPAYAEGMVTYGRVEWRELESAVEYALDRGATTIVLGGASHGGAVTLGLLDRGSLVSEVDAIILDSPASSLEDVFDEAGDLRSLPVIGAPIPESLEDVAKLMVAWRFGVDYSEVDYTDMAGLVAAPLLVFQGTDDQTVPKPVNDRLMNGGAGDAGEYVLVPGAGHVLSWNLDPEGYEQRITDFVAALGEQEQ